MREDARADIPNLITEGRGKRLIFVIVAIVAGLAVAIGAFVYFSGRKASQQKRRAGQAWSAFERCLLGGPLAKGELPFARQRAIELTRWHTPLPTELQRMDPWPKRCLPYAQELYESIAKSGAGAGSALGKLMRGMNGAMGVLKDGKPLPNIDEIWRIADEADLPRFDMGKLTGPPEPARPLLTKASMASLGTRASIAWIAPGSRRLHVVIERDAEVDGSRESLLCSLGEPGIAAAPFSKARCTRLPKLRAAFRALESDDAEPALVNVDAEEGGIFDLAGQPVWKNGEKRLLGGHAKGAHFASLAQVPPRNDFILVSGSAGNVVETALAIPLTASNVQQLGDWIAWVAPGGYKRPHLFARRVTHADPPLAPLVDVGAFGEPDDAGYLREACFTHDRLLIVTGTNADQTFLTSQSGDGFAPLATLTDTPGGRTEMTCFGDAMIYTGDYDTVVQVRCTAAGCGRTESGGDGIASQAQVVGLQDRVLAIWPAEDARNQERGSVWMRLSPIAELAATPDRLLVDGAPAGGISSVLDGIWVWNGLGLVLLADAEDDRSYLLRIDPAGAVTPISLELK